MSGRNREIWFALGAIALVTAVYLVTYQQSGVVPNASGWVGHGIGVVGILLMLMTETLYSIRKRLTGAVWGSMAGWLRFHIFTGLVGPYMVLLHTSMKFQGLAGIAMLLTVVVVASGLVGRYIYTRVPRAIPVSLPAVAATAAADDPPGDVPTEHDEEMRLDVRRQALATWYSMHVPLTWLLFAAAFAHVAGALYYATLQR